MKKPLCLFMIFNLQLQILAGQSFLVKQWDKRFGGDNGEVISSFQQTYDHGYILGGFSQSDSSGDKTQNLKGGNDYWVVKIDSLGNKQWDRDIGSNGDDQLWSVQQTSDGGYILGGSSISGGTSGDKTQPSWGVWDYWIVKIDSLGNKQWDKDFGGTWTDELMAVRQTKDGGYIVGGQSGSGIGGDKTEPLCYNGSDRDFWIVKTDAVGNLQWEEAYGGSNYEFFGDIQQTDDGGYILGGSTASGISCDKTQNTWGASDFWIIKTDSLGNKQWDKDFGGTSSDVLKRIYKTNDGGYILGGDSYSGIGGDKTQPICGTGNDVDYWIIKIDSLGNKQWDKDFGGAWDEDFGNIIQCSDGGYLVSGISDSYVSGDKSEPNLGGQQAWIVKTDNFGIKQWDKTIFTYIYDYAGLSIQSNDGSYVTVTYTSGGIGGYKSQDCWNNSYDYWIIKLMKNPVCFLSSDTSFCDKQYIDFYDLTTNSPTSWQWLFPGGIPSSSTQQNPLGIYYNSYGSFDVTLIACNASGCDTLYFPNFINEFQSPPVPFVTWVVDTLFSTPAFSYQWYFNSNAIPGATGQYYVFQQPGDYFVIITDSNGCSTPSTLLYTGIDEVVDNGGIYVIPNPTDGNFVLYGVKVNSVVKIYDVAGRVLYSDKAKSSPQQVHFEASDGIYFIELGGIGKLNRQKIILKN